MLISYALAKRIKRIQERAHTVKPSLSSCLFSLPFPLCLVRKRNFLSFSLSRCVRLLLPKSRLAGMREGEQDDASMWINRFFLNANARISVLVCWNREELSNWLEGIFYLANSVEGLVRVILRILRVFFAASPITFSYHATMLQHTRTLSATSRNLECRYANQNDFL
jgi:hypothetical protein